MKKQKVSGGTRSDEGGSVEIRLSVLRKHAENWVCHFCSIELTVIVLVKQTIPPLQDMLTECALLALG